MATRWSFKIYQKFYFPNENILRSQEPPSTSVSPKSLNTGSSSTGARVSSMGSGLPFQGLAGLSSSKRSLQLSGRGSIQLGGLPSR